MKIKIRMYLLIFVLVFIHSQSRSQEEKTSFSMEEAMQYAMKNSYVLQTTTHDILIAQKKVWETISIGLPQVSGTANYNAFLNLPVSLLPGEIFGEEPGTYIPVKFGQDYNSDFGLQVSQLIFDGSYIVGIGSTQIYLDLSKQIHEKSQIDIREAVANAYYMVLIGEQYKVVLQNNLENVQKMLKETKIYYENGFREEQDLDQIKLLLRNAESELSKAEREITISKIVLKYAMGFGLDSNLQLTDELNQFIHPLVAKENTLQFDFNSHVDFRMAATNFQMSEKLLNLEKAAYLPRLSGFYNYSKSAYGNTANLFKSSTSWYPSSLVGLQLTMDIFNSGQKRSKVQQARIEMKKAESQRKLAEATLQKDYLSAVAQLETALESYENDKENRELAEKILVKTKIKFENGISSSTELSQIETQYITANQAYVSSTMQLLQADLKLKKVTGNL